MIYSQQIIKNLILTNQKKIQEFGTKRLGLFGSYSRGEQQEDSDLDFLVEFNKEQKNYKNFIHLCYYLEELFGKKVDLLTFESLPKDRLFTQNVLNEVVYFVES